MSSNKQHITYAKVSEVFVVVKCITNQKMIRYTKSSVYKWQTKAKVISNRRNCDKYVILENGKSYGVGNGTIR